MKRTLFFIAALLTFAIGQAQTGAIIGYLSHDTALVHMPQYADVQLQMAELRSAYDKEVQRVEDEFNKKYEEFLDGQREFPRTILLKRQNELQELIQRNITFKQQALSDLKQAKEQALQPLRQQLAEAIAAVAREHGLILVVNTDAEACPYLDPQFAIDIQEEVAKKIGSKPE